MGSRGGSGGSGGSGWVVDGKDLTQENANG